MRDQVARVRQLLEKSRQPRPRLQTQEERDRQAFALYELNMASPAPLEQTPQARAIRDITRVATWYSWGAGVVQRALDDASVGSLQDLAPEQLVALQARMVKYEECAQEGCDPPDAPPAR